MRIYPISSGSSGNCIYVGSESTHILVDSGISGKKIQEGLHAIALDPSDLHGIVITHEHSDHIKGLGVLARKYEIPIYATSGTIREICHTSSVGDIPEDLFTPIRPDHNLIIGDLNIYPMHVSHDASDPVAYRVSYGSKRIGICTDLGVYNDYTVECLKNLDVVLLESNHDVHMLQVGPYSYALKQRILGDRGHLSNERCGQLLGKILHDGMKHIYLGHLSKENNLPELAYEAVRMEITMGSNPYRADDFSISVAKRDVPSQLVEI